MPDLNGSLLVLTILVPAVLSFFALIKPIRRAVGLGAALFVFYLTIRIFLAARLAPFSFEIMNLYGLSLALYADALSSFIIMGCSAFAALLALYSPSFLHGYPGSRFYVFYILLTLAAANGAALSHSPFMLVFFWGFLVVVLYAMMMVARKDPSGAAQKAFLIIGISDVFLILGFILIFVKFGVATMTLNHPLRLDQPLAVFAYILILIGILAKAGAMPLHSWIPEAAKVAPVPTMAFIPASLDKLLGIYMLIRVSYFVFDLHGSMPLRLLLMIIGSVTIVAAVMMAMIQKEAVRLLSFHAVSQVGYMVLGIGTGIPIGIAGGLFHMINHTIYKACLFLSTGSVEYRTKTTDLERLGGLGNKMPLTFLSFIVAALAISGVPPLNGFYSKWMVYQGVVQLSRETVIWPIFLIAAMFGSVLTLASFLKMIHSIFLGSRPKEFDGVKENRFELVAPSLILAFFCIVFGIFAAQIPMKFLIAPSLPFAIQSSGYWSPVFAVILIIIALVIGFVIFLSGTALKPRQSRIFVGGEIMEGEEARIPGTEFYSSIKHIKYLPMFYEKGAAGVYDLFNLLLKFAEGTAAIVFKYVDRVVDQGNYVIAETVRFVSSTLRSLVVWGLIILVVPLLVYATTGSLFDLRVFALMLLVGGPLIAVTENKLNKFLLAIAVGQCGLVMLGYSHSLAVGLLQACNSVVAFLLVAMGIKTAFRLTGKSKIQEISGLVNNAGVISVGFIVGGLMLSSLPPSSNFLGKYMTTSLFEGSGFIICMIGLSSLLNLAAFLRVIRKVFLGPAVLESRKRFGIEELLVVVLIIVSLILAFQAGNVIGYFGSIGGSG